MKWNEKKYMEKKKERNFCNTAEKRNDVKKKNKENKWMLKIIHKCAGWGGHGNKNRKY